MHAGKCKFKGDQNVLQMFLFNSIFALTGFTIWFKVQWEVQMTAKNIIQC